jgi:hypothetical protein
MEMLKGASLEIIQTYEPEGLGTSAGLVEDVNKIDSSSDHLANRSIQTLVRAKVSGA